MSDEAQGASNAPAETVSTSVEPVTSTPAASPEPSQPTAPPSRRDALEKAMATVGEQDAQAQAVKAERERTADGKFAAKAVTLQPGKPGEPVKVVDVNAPAVVAGPPERFTKAAKDAWATTPDAVKADVERAFTELTQGIEKYRADAEGFAPFKQFADLARQNNVDPAQGLKNYVEIDQLLHSDPLNGLLQVCQKTNINPIAAAQAILRQYGGQQTQDGQQQQVAPEVAQLQHVIGQLNSKIAQMEGQFGNFTQTYQQQQQQAKYQSVEQAVIAFASDKPYFAEIAPTVERLIATGYAKDLQEAHDTALRLNPEVQSRLEQAKAAQATQPDPAQTQAKANKSITGTPSSGSNPNTRKASGSPRESVANAFAQLGI